MYLKPAKGRHSESHVLLMLKEGKTWVDVMISNLGRVYNVPQPKKKKKIL